MSELSELFARDPLLLTDPDVSAIIARMREGQAQFELGLKATASVAPKPKKSPKTTELLKDLGFL